MTAASPGRRRVSDAPAVNRVGMLSEMLETSDIIRTNGTSRRGHYRSIMIHITA